MLKERESVLRKSIILLDAILIFLAFFLAFLLRQHFHDIYTLNIFPSTQVFSRTNPSTFNNYLILLYFVIPIWCGMFSFSGMYRSMRIKSFLEVVWILVKSYSFAILVFGAVVFLFKFEFVSRLFFVIFVFISFTFILLEKIAIYSVIRYARRKGYNYRRLLVVGTGRRAAHFVKKIQSHPEWGLKILGAIDDEPYRDVEKVGDVGVIGILKNLPQILHTYAIDEVVFVVPRSRLNHIEDAVYECETEGIRATVAVDLFNMKIAKARHNEIDGIPLVTFDTNSANEGQLFIKRVFDLVVSGLGILFFSPILLFVSVLIKLTSPGPVFFKQTRIGLNGRKFILYKFRTMYKGAEKKLSELESLNEMGGPVFKMKKDPRITPLGRILRKFSIDEFPQLINVFLGHMSMIGPRPPIPEEVKKYEAWQRRRLSMRPGLSCLWQISGRNKIDFDDWMKLDLKYLDNWSLWLDFKIMIKTIPVVVFGIGAY